nr:hypothetical protein [Nocardia transvalensis]
MSWRTFLFTQLLISDDEVSRYLAAPMELLSTGQLEHWSDEDGAIFEYAPDAWTKHPTLRNLALHPRICAIAERVPTARVTATSHDSAAGRRLHLPPRPHHPHGRSQRNRYAAGVQLGLLRQP